MTTSSEDVLLSVGYVRYKKGDGTLYVMNSRLAWMLENRDTVAVSHKYADIKSKCNAFKLIKTSLQNPNKTVGCIPTQLIMNCNCHRI